MILAHSFTDKKGDTKELVYSFYYSLIAIVALACIFIPKIDILVFHPEKDVLYDALRTTTMTTPNTKIRMKERRKSGTQTEERPSETTNS